MNKREDTSGMGCGISKSIAINTDMSKKPEDEEKLLSYSPNPHVEGELTKYMPQKLQR